MITRVELLHDATRDTSEAATKTFTILAQRLPAAPVFHVLGLIKEDRQSNQPTIRSNALEGSPQAALRRSDCTPSLEEHPGTHERDQMRRVDPSPSLLRHQQQLEGHAVSLTAWR